MAHTQTKQRKRNDYVEKIISRKIRPSQNGLITVLIIVHLTAYRDRDNLIVLLRTAQFGNSNIDVY